MPETSETVPRALVQPHLECPICLALYCEPISLSCGHNFCRSCLVNSLKRNKKKCPSCRAVCNLNGEDASENVSLREIVKALDPISYAVRSAEMAKEKADWSHLMPIFYYNDLKFPGEMLELHLFEPRYKLMAQRVVETTRQFAYVPNFTNYAANVGDIAIVARLEECEFLPDGRCMLSAKLASRSLISDHFVEDGTQGLHYCRLQPLSDAPVAVHQQGQMDALLSRLVALWASCPAEHRDGIERAYGPAPVSGPEAFSLWLVALACRSPAERGALLKSTDTMERLTRAAQMFEPLAQTWMHQAAQAQQGGRGGRGGGRGGRGGGRGGRGGVDDELGGAYPMAELLLEHLLNQGVAQGGAENLFQLFAGGGWDGGDGGGGRGRGRGGGTGGRGRGRGGGAQPRAQAQARDDESDDDDMPELLDTSDNEDEHGGNRGANDEDMPPLLSDSDNENGP